MSSLEPTYASISQTTEDYEVAEILNTILETASENTGEESTVFSAIQENENYSPEITTVPGDLEHIIQSEPESNTTIDTLDIPNDGANNCPTNCPINGHNPIFKDYPFEPHTNTTTCPCENTVLHITLLDHIKQIVLIPELQNKYDFPIHAKYIECLKHISEKHPKYFTSFESALFAIVKDGRISIADLPEIMHIVMDLYVILYSLHPKDIVDICMGIVKTIFYIAVKEKLIAVEHETEIIWAFDSFIDSISELLKTHIQLSGCWNNITSSFGRLFRL